MRIGDVRCEVLGGVDTSLEPANWSGFACFEGELLERTKWCLLSS